MLYGTRIRSVRTSRRCSRRPRSIQINRTAIYSHVPPHSRDHRSAVDCPRARVHGPARVHCPVQRRGAQSLGLTSPWGERPPQEGTGCGVLLRCGWFSCLRWCCLPHPPPQATVRRRFRCRGTRSTATLRHGRVPYPGLLWVERPSGDGARYQPMTRKPSVISQDATASPVFGFREPLTKHRVR